MISSLNSQHLYRCIMCVFAIMFVVFSLFYNIFGICFLIIEKQYEDCYLWLYNLLSLVSYNIFVIVLPKSFFFLFIWFFSTIFLFVFGGDQLFYSQCDSFKNKEFYIYGSISFILQCLFMFIIPVYLFRKPNDRIEESGSAV
jgi:hypothetical protein